MFFAPDKTPAVKPLPLRDALVAAAKAAWEFGGAPRTVIVGPRQLWRIQMSERIDFALRLVKILRRAVL